MGKDIHHSIVSFFEEKMRYHSHVTDIINVSTTEHILYNVTRINAMCDVLVFFSDCYHYGEFDYLSNPPELSNGGFILIARPESSFDADTQHHVEDDKIIIGKIGILLGALRIDEYWKCERPKQKEKNK